MTCSNKKDLITIGIDELSDVIVCGIGFNKEDYIFDKDYDGI